MTLSLAVAAPDFGALDTPLLVVALANAPSLTAELGPVDAATNGALGRALTRRDFRGGRDETLHLAGSVTGDRGVQRVLLVGMGPAADRVSALRRAAAIAGRAANKQGVGRLAFFAGALTASEVEAVGLGLIAGSWDFKEFKTPGAPEDERTPLAEATILAADAAARDAGARAARAIGEGHSLARRLGMLPGNVCTPQYLADTARDIAKRLGMTTAVLGREAMALQKMGSFLSVAQGTSQEPLLITLTYSGGPKDAKPIALVGKGLCFDSGGISIKPAQGMEWMKFDMCGAAGVLGAMEAIGRMELPVNVVGLIGATTNMPSGEAVKPGDVVQASNGKFIEIINTDAEGRLVLADVLAFAKQFSPVAVIDAATLTGACVIALGHTATGVMGTDESLVQEVLSAGKRSGEPGWPLPMWDDYKELIKSDVADIKNSGGRPAGTISAAMFLREFAEGYPWVHLDIAGTAYTESDLGTVPRGPTGVPVGTFVEFVRGRAR
jgi:leucyl aminopeptidase